MIPGRPYLLPFDPTGRVMVCENLPPPLRLPAAPPLLLSLLRKSAIGPAAYKLLTTRRSMRWFLGRAWGGPDFDQRLGDVVPVPPPTPDVVPPPPTVPPPAIPPNIIDPPLPPTAPAPVVDPVPEAAALRHAA